MKGILDLRKLDPSVIVFILIMAYMAISGGRFASPGDWLMNVLLTLPGIIIGLAFHEFAHAYSAYRLGDDTPRLQGRVTVNPIAHIDPIGLLCIVFIGFGWGKPVMVNPMNFGQRRRDEIIVSLAGVATNLVLAIVFTIIYAIFFRMAGVFILTTPMGNNLAMIILFAIRINLVLMVFNLIPIPPLDGFNVLSELLRIKYTDIYYKLYQNGMWILMILMILGVVRTIINLFVNPLYAGLLSFARLLMF